MPLMPGTRIGAYEVTGVLGAGGMGEVYRARDTKLDRDVALKVLPEAFTADADRLARFEREAKLLASLNHPNIAAIHGLEDSTDTKALVLELVDGPTLADLIGQGPLTIDDAIPIATQITEALEAAHEAGVIHRDLKPANIKIRNDGTVKVLDFGLAKALDPTPTEGSADPALSPTLTAAATQMGVVMGTAAYMSPEQARGKTVDRRADIWAFGVVLFEMLAGARPFTGEDVSLTLASVMKSDVDVAVLPPDLPDRVRSVLHQCLQKDPGRRIRDIGDVRLALEGSFDGYLTPSDGPPETPALQWWQRPIGFVAGLAIGVGAAVSLGPLVGGSGTGPEPVTRLTITIPPGQRLGTETNFALSPDGRTVVYAATSENVSRLYVRPLGSFEAVPMSGTEGAMAPFFSPDGQWVGFGTEDRRLRKVAVAGGGPITIVSEGATLRYGATWGEDGTITYVPSLGGGLWRVSADGGAVEQLTRPDGAGNGYAHVFPQVVPGLSGVLFTIWGAEDRVVAHTPDTEGWRDILSEVGQGVYLPGGRLAYSTEAELGNMLVRPFDPGSLTLSGSAVSVLDDVGVHPSLWRHAFRVSSTGTLAYRPRSVGDLVWVDHEGRVESTGVDVQPGVSAQISPDGTRIVVRPLDELVRVIDLERGTRTAVSQLNQTDGNLGLLWSPDGEELTMGSNLEGDWDVYLVSADGSGEPRMLLRRPLDQFSADWSADGRVLAYVELHPDTDADVWVLPVDGEPSPFLDSPSAESQPAFSPDGLLMAYVSNESGRDEVYLQAFPDGGAKRTVSTDGGRAPGWSPDGDRLFYFSGDQLMAVDVSGGDGRRNRAALSRALRLRQHRGRPV